MEYKVAELEGALLDAAVAKAEGHDLTGMASQGEFGPDHKLYLRGEFGSHKQFAPSTEWAHGGPLIERERIMLISAGPDEWSARIGEVLHALSGDPIPDGSGRSGSGWGETALIAAMRAFCASRFGETVELP